jgi:phosphoribosylformimino-5-aminoimidazole carboxamide ribonucleotide (ProFAR) isomerase
MDDIRALGAVALKVSWVITGRAIYEALDFEEAEKL